MIKSLFNHEFEAEAQFATTFKSWLGFVKTFFPNKDFQDSVRILYKHQWGSCDADQQQIMILAFLQTRYKL